MFSQAVTALSACIGNKMRKWILKENDNCKQDLKPFLTKLECNLDTKSKHPKWHTMYFNWDFTPVNKYYGSWGTLRPKNVP